MNSKYKVLKFISNKFENFEDLVSIEEPLEISLKFKENNETYLEHMKHAMGISFLLLSTGTKCLIHSIVPPLFETGVSSKLYDIITLVKRNETIN